MNQCPIFFRMLCCWGHQTPALTFQSVGKMLLPNMSVESERMCKPEWRVESCSFSVHHRMSQYLASEVKLAPVTHTEAQLSPFSVHSKHHSLPLHHLRGFTGAEWFQLPEQDPDIVPCQGCTLLQGILRRDSLWSNL